MITPPQIDTEWQLLIDAPHAGLQGSGRTFKLHFIDDRNRRGMFELLPIDDGLADGKSERNCIEWRQHPITQQVEIRCTGSKSIFLEDGVKPELMRLFADSFGKPVNFFAETNYRGTIGMSFTLVVKDLIARRNDIGEMFGFFSCALPQDPRREEPDMKTARAGITARVNAGAHPATEAGNG